jgi:O-antigen/teichoic acid export membrane protein
MRGEAVSRTALYVGAGFVQRVAGFLLVPILIATLPAETYARYGLLTSAVGLLVPLLSLNLHLAPQRLYFDCFDLEGRRRLLRLCAGAGLGGAVLGSVVLVLLLQLSGIGDPITGGRLPLQALVLLVVLAVVPMEFAAALMRIEGRAGAFVLLAGLQGFGLLGGYLALAGVGGDGLLRVLLAYALAYGATAVAGTLYALPRLIRPIPADGAPPPGDASPAAVPSPAAGPSPVTGASPAAGACPDLAAITRFAWPTALHLVALWGIMFSGRWIGALFEPLSNLAAYTLVTQVVGITAIFSRALFSARLPEIGSAFGGGDRQGGMRIINTTVAAALALTLLIYAGAAAVLFGLRLNLPAGYAPSALLLGLAAGASLFDTLYLRGIQGLTALKRTGRQAAATMTAGGATIALSFLLAARWGDLGLASALAAGFGLQALLSNQQLRLVLRRPA